MRLSFGKPTSLKASPYAIQYVRTFTATSAKRLAALQEPKRQLRSALWIPQATLAQSKDGNVDANQLLVRAGYFRQAYSGIFHMLPLGLRVQSKIEALVDKHMQSLDASKVSLSSISSQKLWEKSGRLNKGSEFFKFKDRKNAPWLLAPTHEEEITNLVKDVIFAPGHLPIRLYQISRKYRDEKRPRGGLLRGREFIMKDLYTFDKTEADAHVTYNQVRKAYSNLFDEFRLPYIEARADSGNMGGSLSHEFHFPSNLGEDDIITCSNCDYAKNEEFVPQFAITTRPVKVEQPKQDSATGAVFKRLQHQSFVSRDRRSIVKAYVSLADSGIAQLNPFAVKEALSEETEVDTGVEDAATLIENRLESGERPLVYYLFDQLASDQEVTQTVRSELSWLEDHHLQAIIVKIYDDLASQSHLVRKRTGDSCPDCAAAGRDGKLNVTKAIEVGHTFHLGNRYSSRFDLVVPTAGQKASDTQSSHVEMGCHGIGVSRLLAAVASALSDSTGLIWPRVIAPFEVLVVVNKKHKDYVETIDVGNQIYDELSKEADNPADVLIDDRDDVDFGWKLKDADLIGYPVVVIIGKGWLKKRLVEVQCRCLKVKEEVPLEEAASRVRELLGQL